MLRCLLVMTVFVGCDRPAASAPPPAPKGSAGAASADAPPPDPRLVRVPSSVPRGPYVVRYDCFHSNMPFGEGSQSRTLTFDLGTKRRFERSIVDDGKGKPPAPAVAPTVTQMPQAKVATLTAAVDKVLRGGPYLPEYPPSEGTACSLQIGVGTTTPFFQIDKAGSAERDAVSELLRTFY